MVNTNTPNKPKRTGIHADTIDGETDPFLNGDVESGIDSDTQSTTSSNEDDNVPWWVRSLIRVFMVMVTFGIVAAFGCKRKKLDQLVSIVGGCLDSMALMFFPLISYQVLKYRVGDEPTCWQWPERILHLFFGIICLGVMVNECVNSELFS